MVPPLKTLVASFCLAAALTAPAVAQQINNLSKWVESGFDSIQPLGLMPATPTYGQTFRLPTDYDQMSDFSFQLRSSGTGDVRFIAYLSEWDDAAGSLTGSLLYLSATQTLPSSTATSFTPFTFSFPTLTLDPTKTYIAFLSTSAVGGNSAGGSAEMGSPNFKFSDGVGAAYTGGRFVYFGNDSFNLLYDSKWEGIEADDEHRDAAFVANFSRSSQLVAVPEPATYGMIAVLTLSGAIAFRRFRSRSKA